MNLQLLENIHRYLGETFDLDEGYKEVRAKFGDDSEGVIEDFKELLKRNIIKDANEKNIDYWGKQGFEKFTDFVNKMKNVKSNTEVKKDVNSTPHKDAKLIGETKNYEVYHIPTYECAKFMGRFYKNISTSWCISTDNEKHFNTSYATSCFYFFILKDDLSMGNKFSKVALQMPSDTIGDFVYWDASDKNHNDDGYDLPSEIINFGKTLEFIDRPFDFKSCIYGSFEIVDGVCNVDGSVDLNRKQISKIPIQFGVVSGGFNCEGNNLKSLKGCPTSVGIHFYCGSNKIESLKYAPQKVGGDFMCTYNDNLSTLEGVEIDIGGDFICFKTFKIGDMTRLKLPSTIKVGGDFHS
jgi:hypothetical protein